MTATVSAAAATGERPGKMIVNRPMHEITCTRTVMNTPNALRIELRLSAPVPYSRRRICGSVTQPLRRSGPTKPSARNRQPSPEPSVNHQADSPKWNASCAVPIVA